MQTLIQDLYSRLSTSAREFEPAPMGAVLNCALDNIVNAVKESQAVITHDRLPTIRGDAHHSWQISCFKNLPSNAIKFSGESPPRIHISARREENEWRFSVHDHGIGIDPQYAGRIFVIFQRFHTRAEYPAPGSAWLSAKDHRTARRMHLVESNSARARPSGSAFPIRHRRRPSRIIHARQHGPTH